METMKMDFYSEDVWPHITEIVDGAGEIHAAIAFLGNDASDRLPLKAGDVLLVNARADNVSSRATSPFAIERFINRGVKVYSSERLHAKVIATDKHAIVGSANASASSARSSEAIIVTDSTKDRRSVKEFVLREINNHGMEIIPEKLEDLKRLYKEGEAIPGITGVNTSKPQVTGFPWAVENVYLVTRCDADLTDEEREKILTGTTRPTGFNLDVMQIENVEDAYKRGDIVIFCDDTYIYPPVKIDSDVVFVNDEESRMGQATQKRRKGMRDLMRSRFSPRYVTDTESFDDLMDILDEASGHLKLSGARRDAMLRVWFPEFKELSVSIE
ncbi:phospholipase D-like domain-containing protein [Glutamicibacter ardleyensis]|uniref:phospholipase D-like domain-containing protein n=1 Tax=Glutamicibacter ardleyensis TaxID=225894 RepID=UPI003FCF0C9C